MSTIPSIVCFLLLGALLFYSKLFRQLSPFGRGIVWIAKGFSALALIYIYTNVYPERREADIFKYFDDSRKLTEIAKENPFAFERIILGTWETSDLIYLNRMNYWFRSYDHGLANDNRIVIRANALINIITQGDYGLNLSFFLFLSFLGCYWIYAFLLHFNPVRITAFSVAFLIPSSLFWSSGILKESLLIFSIGGFLYSLLALSKKRELRFALLALLTLYILLFLKIYILMALVPILIMVFYYNLRRSWMIAAIGSLATMVGLYFVVGYLTPEWSVLSTLQGKQFDFIQMAKAVNAGSQIWVIPMDGTWWTLMKLVPLGIFNCLVFPSFSMLENFLSWNAFIENSFLVLLLLGALISMVQGKKAPFWTLGMLLFSFTVFSLIGMTAPVVGAMVRYKAPVLPFFVFGLLHLQPKFMVEFLNNQKIIQWLTTRL